MDHLRSSMTLFALTCAALCTASQNYDYAKIAGSTAILNCSGGEAETEWLMDGHLIDYKANPRIYKGPNSKLVITATKDHDSSIYDCVSKISHDDVYTSVNLTIQDVPNPPQLIEQECFKNKSGIWHARVSWQQTSDNRSPITGYVIEYNTSYYPETWELAHQVPALENHITFPLKFGMNYTFRAIAVNAVGPSLQSPNLERCAVPPAIPFEHPAEVRGRGDEPGNLVISWKPMSETEHNGPGFFYRVFWKRVNAAVWNTTVIRNWQLSEVVVLHLPTYVPFRIKVEAHNSQGISNATAEEVICYSGEDVPLEPPRNFTVVRVHSATSAEVTWKHVHPNSIRGEFKGYKVQTWTAKEGVHGLREVKVQPDVNRTVINILKPCADNFVRIVAYNGKYNGPHIKALCVLTPEGVAGPVERFDIYPMNSGFRLVWKEPLEKNGNLTGYIINTEQIGTMEVPAMNKEVIVADPRATRSKVFGLSPNSTYRVTIRATNSKGPGYPYNAEAVTKTTSVTPPDKPIFEWREKSEFGNGHATVLVTWIPDLNGNPGSQFYVEYRKKGNSVYTRTEIVRDEDSVLIAPLEPDRIYEMKVTALDGDHGISSGAQVVRTSVPIDLFQAYLRKYTSYLYVAIQKEEQADCVCLNDKFTIDFNHQEHTE